MNKNDLTILILASALGVLGFLSGFIYSLIQGCHYSKWGYFIIFMIIAALGLAMIIPLFKLCIGFNKKEEKQNPRWMWDGKFWV